VTVDGHDRNWRNNERLLNAGRASVTKEDYTVTHSLNADKEIEAPFSRTRFRLGMGKRAGPYPPEDYHGELGKGWKTLS